MPERCAAASGGTSCNFLFGGVHPRHRRSTTPTTTSRACGWGGRATTDGNDAQIVPHGNCRNTPVEVFETRYPWLHEEYQLNPDTGGPGRTRGGLGITRVMTVEADEIVVSALCDRSKVAPWGIFGGGDGGRTGVPRAREAARTFQTFSQAFGTPSDTKFSNVRLQRGDRCCCARRQAAATVRRRSARPSAWPPMSVRATSRARLRSASYGVVVSEDGEEARRVG